MNWIMSHLTAPTRKRFRPLSFMSIHISVPLLLLSMCNLQMLTSEVAVVADYGWHCSSLLPAWECNLKACFPVGCYYITAITVVIVFTTVDYCCCLQTTVSQIGNMWISILVWHWNNKFTDFFCNLICKITRYVKYTVTSGFVINVFK